MHQMRVQYRVWVWVWKKKKKNKVYLLYHWDPCQDPLNWRAIVWPQGLTVVS